MKDEDTLEQIELISKEKGKPLEKDDPKELPDRETGGWREEPVYGTKKVEKDITPEKGSPLPWMLKKAAGKTLFGYKSFVGEKSLLTGLIFIDTGKEFCPWSPQIPEFLLTYGILLLSLSAIICMVMDMCPCKSKWKFLIFLHGICFVIDFGAMIWGLILIYSPLKEATFSDFDYNKANGTYSRSDNYCHQLLYSAIWIGVWLSIGLYVGFGLLVCCCLCCVTCIMARN